MSETITPCTDIPAQIEQGDYVSFTQVFDQYPATDWTAALIISQGTAAPISVSGTVNAVTGFLFTLASNVSATLLTGQWDYSIYATAAGNRRTARTGAINVIANLAVAQTASQAQTIVDTLTATLTTVSAQKYASTDFNGQSKQAADIDKLQKAITFWKAQVINEQEKANAARGVGNGRSINTYFVPPSEQYPFHRYR